MILNVVETEAGCNVQDIYRDKGQLVEKNAENIPAQAVLLFLLDSL